MPLSDHILFTDLDAIVIDKPAGLPVDAPRAGGDSIAARIGELKLNFQRPPRPVHRLDRDTSGCLLFARNPKAMAALGQAFEAGVVTKVYRAVVEAAIGGEGMIDLPLVKTSSIERGWRMVGDEGCGNGGKPARTRWRAIRSSGERTLVEFRPETGRTHQIRAHSLHGLGAAIAGDPVYGDGEGPLLLHALRLVVPRKGKPDIDVTAPLPDRFGDWRDEG